MSAVDMLKLRLEPDSLHGEAPELFDDDGLPLFVFYPLGKRGTPEVLERIVASVNACEGVEQDWLESGLPGCLQNVRKERDQYQRERDAAISQRDALLAALEGLVARCENYGMGTECADYNVAVLEIAEAKDSQP